MNKILTLGWENVISKNDYQKIIDRNVNKLKAYHYVSQSDYIRDNLQSLKVITKGLIVNIKI